jgi:hypothetical protein
MRKETKRFKMVKNKLLRLKYFLESKSISDADSVNEIISIASEIAFDPYNLEGSGYKKTKVGLGNVTITAEKISMPQGDIFISNQQEALGAVNETAVKVPGIGRMSGDLSLETRFSFFDKEMNDKIKNINISRYSDFAVSMEKSESASKINYAYDDERIAEKLESKLSYQLELYKEAADYFKKIVYEIMQNTNGATKTEGTSYDEFSEKLQKIKPKIEDIQRSLDIVQKRDIYSEEFSKAMQFGMDLPAVKKQCWYNERIQEEECVYDVFLSGWKSPFQDGLKFHTSGGETQLIDVGCGYYALGYGIKDTKTPVFIKNENFNGKDVVIYKNSEFRIFKKEDIDNPKYEIIKSIEGCDIDEEYKYQKANKKLEKRKGPMIEYTPPKAEKREDLDSKPLTFDQFKKMTEKPDFDWSTIKDVDIEGYKTRFSDSWSEVCEVTPDHPMCKYNIR